MLSRFHVGMITALCLVALSLSAQTVTVTGHLKAGNTAPLSAGTKLHFELVYCGQNVPQIVGVGDLGKLDFDLTLGHGMDATGTVSAQVYGNDVITCGNITGGSRWRKTIIVNNQPGPACDLDITTDNSPFNLDIGGCINVAPVPTPPTPETMYLRTDGANATPATANYVRSFVPTTFPAAAITGGVFDLARIPVLDNGRIPFLDASKLATGTLDPSRLPSVYLPLAKLKRQRFGPTCQPTATAGSFCSTSYTWTTAFADTNYTLSCTPSGPQNGVASFATNAKTAAGFDVIIEATTNASSYFGEVDCIAIHD